MATRLSEKPTPVPTLKPRPRNIYWALVRLERSARHVEARSSDLTEAVRNFRSQERLALLKELLQALRSSPAGDLVRDNTGGDPTQQALIGVLTDSSGIEPYGRIGDVIQTTKGELPADVELDRPLGGEVCGAVRIEAICWKCGGKILLRRLVSPVV